MSNSEMEISHPSDLIEEEDLSADPAGQVFSKDDIELPKIATNFPEIESQNGNNGLEIHD